MTATATTPTAPLLNGQRTPSPASPNEGLQIRGLTKAFGPQSVLRGVEAAFPAGQVTALLGPNGSGKTTLIKCLLGLVRPDAGHLTFAGQPLDAQGKYRARIGYMPQATRFPDNLTAADLIALLTDLRGHPETRDEALLTAFDLAADLHQPLQTRSGGTRQKVSAALAFLFAPDLLILDEPTAGLDPIANGTFKDHVRRARDRGVTVLLTSHVLSEVEQLADRVVFLLGGTVRYSGPVAALLDAAGQDRLESAIAHLMRGASA